MADLKGFVNSWLPPLAGVTLIALFVSLALWQLERAGEKEALLALFDTEAAAVPLATVTAPALYQPLSAEGRYLPGRQVLVDNIIREGRVGWYVLTPFESGGRLYLVNRGGIGRQPGQSALPDVDVGGGARRIEARAGRLPRVALRPEQAFSDEAGWPRVAVYPELADVERVLDRPLEDTVLLLAPAEPDGFHRDWRPPGRGPSVNYGYAFQWAALALTVLVILAWQMKKRFRHE